MGEGPALKNVESARQPLLSIVLGEFGQGANELYVNLVAASDNENTDHKVINSK